jgi:hypothetical protein
MSVPPDPTEPTRPVPPATVPTRPIGSAYLEPEEVLWRDEVLSRLRSHTTALTVAVAVAFVALGISLWALLGDGGSDEGVGRDRVRALEERVDRLESAAGRGVTDEQLANVQERQRVLAQRLAALSNSVGQPSDDVEALQTAIDATQQAVEQLDQRVAALEQGQP